MVLTSIERVARMLLTLGSYEGHPFRKKAVKYRYGFIGDEELVEPIDCVGLQ